MPLDLTSWALLAALQTNARASLTDLGRQGGLTPAAVAERIRRMEASGVIQGYHARLDLTQLGFPLQAFIQLRISQNRYLALPRAITAVLALDEVLECHRITGDDCLLLKVAVTSVAHLERLTDQLLQHGETTTSLIVGSPVGQRVIGPGRSPLDD